MPKIKDLTNLTIGLLKVVKLSHIHPKGYGKVYECKCKCGNTKLILSSSLSKDNPTKSCGCLKSKKERDKVMGKKFGRLLVKSFSHKDSKFRQIYNLECECGNTIKTYITRLKNKQVQSCGCLQRETASKLGKKRIGRKNHNYRHGLSKNYLIKNRLTKKDLEWSKTIKDRDGYSCTTCNDSTGGNLVSHHLNAFASFPEQRYLLSNGVCLCEKCHNEFHKLYGKGKNTESQYIEFEYYKKI